MISKRYARKFCCEDLSLIENYDKAIADTTLTWICHHILGEQYSKKYLKENGLYENRPASELRFVTKHEHNDLHLKGVLKGPMSEEHKQAISNALKGVPRSEATKQKLSKKILQFTKSGEFIREWPSMTAIWQELGIPQSNICACCKERYTSTGGYVWRYAE